MQMPCFWASGVIFEMYASGSSNSSAVGWKTMASGTVLSTLLCCLREFSMAWETREGKRGSVVGTSWGLPVGNLKNRKRGARARYEAGRPENLREKRPKKKPFLTHLATAFEPVSVTGNPERERVNVPVTKKKK